ncbi:MAG: phosphate ABC transporter permease subunit PstC [Phycisphaerae bacterium]
MRTAREAGIHGFLLICALLSVITTVAIIYVLVAESVPFFTQINLGEFFTGTTWEPALQPPRVGILPLVAGTTIVALGALLFALPIGVGTAIFLSEYAPESVRQVLKPVLEILAGIPSVVYGYFALTFVTPALLKPLIPNVEIFNAASAAIVVGLMILPMISSLCDDAFRAVPRSLREGAYALAATKFEVSARVVLPGALSGVVAAVLLALSRAIGETMAVAIAAGMRPTLTIDPRQPVQTMTGYIVSAVQGYQAQGSVGYQALFGVGLSLFLITLGINLIARRVMAHFREVYE